MAKQYFPAFLDLENQPCVVVGGGKIAADKIHGLLQAGAAVTVVAPHASSRITLWAQAGLLRWLEREYCAGDLAQAELVIAATGDAAINQQVYEEGMQRHLLVNVVDSPAQCNYITPSIIRRDPFLLAISTQGIAPALAAVIRRYLERQLDKRLGPFLEQAALWRIRLRREESSAVVRHERWRRLVARAAPILLGVETPPATTSDIFRSALARERRARVLPLRHGKTPYLGAVGFDLLSGRIEDLETCQTAFAQEIWVQQQFAKLQHHSGKPLLEGWVVVAEKEFVEVFYQTSHTRLARRALCVLFERQLEPSRLVSHPMSYVGPQAINHLFRVACGLHSAVPLETEVHGVLRRALLKAGMQQTLSVPLEQAFRAALAVAGWVGETNAPRTAASESIHALLRLAAARLPQFGDCRFAVVMEMPWAVLVQRLLIAQGVAPWRIKRHAPWQQEQLVEELLAATLVEGRHRHVGLVLIVDSRKGAPRLSQASLRALLTAGVARIWVLDAGIPRVLAPAAAALYGVSAWDLTDVIKAQMVNGTQQARIAAVQARIAPLAAAYYDRHLARPKHD